MKREFLEPKDDSAVKKAKPKEMTTGKQENRSTTFHASKNFRQALRQKMAEAENEEQIKLE